MRIISGKARGLNLKTLKGDITRPTRDIVREAMFDIIQSRVADCVFLDLFAGSGAVGIEALSRGACEVYFSDRNRDAIKVIKENINKAGFEAVSTVICGDYQVALDKMKDVKFDVIFIDPPYNMGMGVSAIEKIAENDMLAESGVIIYETDSDENTLETIMKYRRYDYRKYGRNILNFYT